jgi:hypothetical protein
MRQLLLSSLFIVCDDAWFKIKRCNNYYFGVKIYHKFIFIIAQNYQEGEVTQLIKKNQNLIILHNYII